MTEPSFANFSTMRTQGARATFTDTGAARAVLDTHAVEFLKSLHLRFGRERERLLLRRAERAQSLLRGELPAFLPQTAAIRGADWKVNVAPRPLRRRHVEITGPCEAKMMVNALNSGANCFMADLEDSLSPTWENVLHGHANLRAAARGTLRHESADGKVYAQGENTATLLVRPRGWHLLERNFLVNGEPISASLFDFGLAFFHNARALVARGSGPYFYLPKLESHLEARLWNEVFEYAQHALGLPVGTIRATVLIETVLAAFEMDEILFELRDHASGLNAGRWDYLFSVIKKLEATNPLFPDRAHLTMELPFLRSYCELLVQTCHRRGAHAIGGMSAFIPSRRDSAVNERALAKVRADKAREIHLGFDGSWVAHPDLVAPVKTQFEAGLRGADHQKELAPLHRVRELDLLPAPLPEAPTAEGFRLNMEVSLAYLHQWLNGHGAVAIHHLMEDAATAEISRAQLWQWVRRGARLECGTAVDAAYFERVLAAELERLHAAAGLPLTRRVELQELMRLLVLDPQFVEFLTLPAYELLLGQEREEGGESQPKGELA